ncbi:MAG: hypothetical protein Q9181_002917 [Wetmoreana brouardii]
MPQSIAELSASPPATASPSDAVDEDDNPHDAPAKPSYRRPVITVPAALQPTTLVESLVCTDCRTKLQDDASAEFHATTTGHMQITTLMQLRPSTAEEIEAEERNWRQVVAWHVRARRQAQRQYKTQDQVDSGRASQIGDIASG